MTICKTLRDWINDRRRIKNQREIVDKIHVRGEVEIIAHYPEYQKEIDKIIVAGRGSPKSNWMPNENWAWQKVKNTIVDGHHILPSIMAYENTDGINVGDYTMGYADSPPRETTYINRPQAMMIRDSTAGGGPYYYNRWIRGEDELIGAINAGGSDYVRYVTQIPTTDTDSHTGTARFNGSTMNIDQIDLRGFLGIGCMVDIDGVGNLLLNAGKTALSNDFLSINYHITQPVFFAIKDTAGIHDIIAPFGWPDDYTLDADRHNLTIKAAHLPAYQSGIFCTCYIADNLTAVGATGRYFSSLVLGDVIPKDNSFALSLIWKLIFD